MSETDIIFEAARGSRFHRYGRSVTTFRRDAEHTIWWSRRLRRWITDEARRAAYDEGWDPECSSHCSPVRTLRAFRWHLRRHAAQLAGFEVVWVNRYEGHNARALLQKTAPTSDGAERVHEGGLWDEPPPPPLSEE